MMRLDKPWKLRKLARQFETFAATQFEKDAARMGVNSPDAILARPVILELWLKTYNDAALRENERRQS